MSDYYANVGFGNQGSQTACTKQQPNDEAFWAKATSDPIAAFTGVLAVATIGLWFFTARLWKVTSELSKEAKITGNSQAEQMERSIKTAEAQTALMGFQSDILVAQKELSRLQFFGEHRPRLVLKDVFFHYPDNHGEVLFEIANIGGSDATIIDGFTSLNYVRDPRNFKSQDEGSLDGLKGCKLGAGELKEFTRALPGTTQQDGILHFFGVILYVDGRGEEFGITRRSVFRRIYDNKIKGFRRIPDNPDAEYAD